MTACGQLGFESFGDGPLVFVPAAHVNNDDSTTFVGSCAVGGGSVLGEFGGEEWSVPCTGGRFEVVVRAATDGLRYIRAYQDGAAAMGSWRRDTISPSVTAFDLGPEPARTRVLPVQIRANDNHEVSAYCLTSRETAPTGAEDLCFVPLAAPAPNVELGPIPFAVGPATGSYRVNVYVRDSAGNMSEGEARTIDVSPSAPPVLERLVATNLEDPGRPPTVEQTQVAEGEPIFVSWFADDDETLPTTPLELEYTLDDVSFSPLGAYENSAAGCTPVDGRTGCVVVSAPTSSYFRLRARLRDAQDQLASATSPGLNTPVQYLAGTTDAGTGASAATGSFVAPVPETNNSSRIAMGGLVVLDDGTIYLRDARGVVEIAADTGTARVLLAETGNSTGDDGPAASATATRILKIATDGAGLLYVWDADRIRAIALDVGDNPIRTAIGGGDATGDVEDALSLQINPPTDLEAGRHAFSAAPNGDLYFVSDAVGEPGARLRQFDASENEVRSIRVSGEWNAVDVQSCRQVQFAVAFSREGDPIHALVAAATTSTGECRRDSGSLGRADILSFDAASGLVDAMVALPDGVSSYYGPQLSYPITGADGVIYYNLEGMGVARYDVAAGQLVRIGGAGSGYCEDGTSFMECPVRIQDISVTRDGTLYLWDNNLLRFVDETGRIQTLYGRRLDAGDGGDPLAARFANIATLHLTPDERIAVLDSGTSRIRLIRPGYDVVHLAGNGLGNQRPSYGEPATSEPLYMRRNGTEWATFQVVGDDLYYSSYYDLALLRDGVWSQALGGGTTMYFEATTPVDGASLTFQRDGETGFPQQVLARRDSTLLIATSVWDSARGVSKEGRLFEFDTTSGLVTMLGGAANVEYGLCADGTALSECALALNARMVFGAWHPGLNAWLIGTAQSRAIRILRDGQMQTLHSMDEDILGLSATESALYVCGESGTLIEVTQPTGATRVLPVGSPTIRCSGPLEVQGDRLFFVFQQGSTQAVGALGI